MTKNEGKKKIQIEEIIRGRNQSGAAARLLLTGAHFAPVAALVPSAAGISYHRWAMAWRKHSNVAWRRRGTLAHQHHRRVALALIIIK